MNISVIIPTLNEASCLARAVIAVRRHATGEVPEIIVADCGSTDGTVGIARELGVSVIANDPFLDCKAAALNRGAAHASRDVLLFLDADCLVPPGYDRAMAHGLDEPGVVGGAFEFELEGREIGLRLVEIINRIRYRLWPRYYGDQGIFVRTEVFRRTGGFPRRRILEASDFCRTVARHGRLTLLRARMPTSARRFVEGGIYRVLAHDTWIWWLDLIGQPTEQFGRAYQENNHQRGQRLPTGSTQG